MGNSTKVIIGGDTSGAVAAIGRLKTELTGLQGFAAKALNWGSAIAGAAVVSSLIATTKAVIDQGDALNKMSQKTGLAVEDLSKLQYAADLSGVSSESLTKGLTALSVGMVEAGTGVGATAELYKKFGISVRNTDGTMKSSGAVLGEWADKFKVIPDDVDQLNLAVDVFGKKIGGDWIPLLNGGADALKTMGDEAQALGLVMSGDLAKKSEEFNDNLERMQKLSTAAGISIASALIPSLNKLLTEFVDGRKASLGFFDSIATLGMLESAEKSIDRVSKKLEELKNKKASGGSSLFGDIDKDISRQEKLLAYYKLQQDRQSGDGVASAEELAAKRLGIERQLQSKMASLATLRAIAEGKVSSTILDTDTKRTDAQIANANRLRDALSSAWQKSLADAQAAGDAAKSLFDKSADVRQSGSDKSAAKLRSQLTPEEQQAQIQSEFESAASAAQQSAGLATIAALHGRLESAAKLTAQAEKDAERAAKFADQIDDPLAGSSAIQRAAEIQAQVLEAQAKAKQSEQKNLQERAASQAELIAKLDAQLSELQAKAAAIKVEADIEAASGAIVTLQSQLDNLKDKTITVTVNQVGGGTTDTAPGTGGQFASGGWTGWGGKYDPAGIVHRREFVTRSEITGQAGAVPFLSRFNQVGMRAIAEFARLNGYASGGLVGNIRLPSMPSSASSAHGPNATFVWPGMDPIDAYVAPDVLGAMTTTFKRQALKRGLRK